MVKFNQVCLALFALAGILRCQAETRNWNFDFSGYAELQERNFWQREYASQDYSYFSGSLSPRWRVVPGRDDALTLRLFARHDFSDPSRTHEDIREALWQHFDGEQEWRIGIDEVFWGVTESRHLVDIINQTDYLERIDGDAKLGQPMINWNWQGRRNSVELYFLPYFREAEFPDAGGRFRTPLPVTDASYTDGASEDETSAAVRWHYSGLGSDLALSYFEGVSRDPRYDVVLQGGQLRIQPTYVGLSQWGLEAQRAVGDWLLKAEAIYREADTESWAGVTGFEYTFNDTLGGTTGLLLEYLRDTREWVPADTFQDDIFIGIRYASSSLSSTNMLAGFYQDRRHGGRVFKLKLDTRLAQKFKLSLELWRFDGLRQQELASLFQKDDYLEFSLRYYWAN